jgi:nucleoside-diphosphate-sugar epimerase
MNYCQIDTIAITGSSGFIGTRLVSAFDQKGIVILLVIVKDSYAEKF